MTFSALSAHAEEFLALKRAVAKADPHGNSQDRRSLKHREKLLRSFVAYWRDQQCPWPIRFSLVLDWVAVGSDRQQPYRDQLRFYVVRAFLQQIRTFEPATEIPQNIYRPLYRRRTPHLYSEDDITRLMKAARRLQRVTPFRRVTVYALIGLLASTGLRIGEALALEVDDVRLNADRPHLLIFRQQVRQLAQRRSPSHGSEAVEKVPDSEVESIGRSTRKGVLHEPIRQASELQRAAVDVSQASEARRHPGRPWRTWSIASLFPSLIRGEETHPLASREKRRTEASAPPRSLSRPRWPRKYLLVSERHSGTPPHSQYSF
jgi:integrase